MKFWLQFISWFNRKAKNFAIRLVKWTGKSREYVHPKHLTCEEFHYWFKRFLNSNDVVLDLGCGNGAHGLIAAQIAKKVKGIDHFVYNLEIARKLAAQKGMQNISFEEGFLENPIAEPSNVYSVILALDVLEHLTNRDLFLEETSRLLTQRGKLFISVPNRETSWKRLLASHGLFFYSDLDHKYEYTKDEIKNLLERHGYQILHFEPTVFDTPWVGLIDMMGGVSLSIYKRLSAWKRSAVLRNPEESTGFRIIAEKKV